MTHMTTPIQFSPLSSSSLATGELHDFFDRLSAGDYHSLPKELRISPRLEPRPRSVHRSPAVFGRANGDGARSRVGPEPDAASSDVAAAVIAPDSYADVDPNTSIQSIDSVDSFKFQPTAEGLHRAASLLRGDKGLPSADGEGEDEAFQFTFRLMIHKLYSIKDFATMVADVVRTSQERFRPLSPDVLARRDRRRRSLSVSFSFAAHDANANATTSDGDSSFVSMASPSSETSFSSVLLPSSPATSVSWAPDRFSSPPLEGGADEADVRAVKKRIVGRKLSIVDSSHGLGADEKSALSRAWVYDSTVASVESPSSYYYDAPLSPAAGSPSRYGGDVGYLDEGDSVSRKRRFSFLAARGL